jgi:hypothetical protein
VLFRSGQGICGVCSRVDRAAAEAEFLALVARHGARLTDGAAYVDAHTPVEVICAEEHRRAIRPHDLKNKRRKNLCSICSGKDKTAVEARLWALVEQRGACRVNGTEYVNRTTSVALICDLGHLCDPLPSNVLAPGGARTRSGGAAPTGRDRGTCS